MVSGVALDIAALQPLADQRIRGILLSPYWLFPWRAGSITPFIGLTLLFSFFIGSSLYIGVLAIQLSLATPSRYFDVDQSIPFASAGRPSFMVAFQRMLSFLSEWWPP